MKASLLHKSLAVTTRKSYNSGIRAYTIFCVQTGINHLPLRHEYLENFAISLRRRVGYKTIKLYLSALQVSSILQGYTERIRDMSRLHYVLRAIRREQGNTHVRPRRLPITFRHIRELKNYIARAYCPFDCVMLTAAITTAFFGLLRVSEYTSHSVRAYDPEITLLRHDIRFSMDYSVVHIWVKASKTDPFRSGVTIRLGATKNEFCPVRALDAYISLRGPAAGPLFRFSDGTYLIRRHLDYLIRHGITENANLHSHSFRIGAASLLCSIGLPDSVIQILGRWTSDAFRRYIHLTDPFIVNTARSMTSADLSIDRVWVADTACSDYRDRPPVV